MCVCILYLDMFTSIHTRVCTFLCITYMYIYICILCATYGLRCDSLCHSVTTPSVTDHYNSSGCKQYVCVCVCVFVCVCVCVCGGYYSQTGSATMLIRGLACRN